jgi:hypothetical protein
MSHPSRRHPHHKDNSSAFKTTLPPQKQPTRTLDNIPALKTTLLPPGRHPCLKNEDLASKTASLHQRRPIRPGDDASALKAMLPTLRRRPRLEDSGAGFETAPPPQNQRRHLDDDGLLSRRRVHLEDTTIALKMPSAPASFAYKPHCCSPCLCTPQLPTMQFRQQHNK